MATPATQRPPASRDDFAIAIICALPEERDTVETLMTRDYKAEGHPPYGKTPGDDNVYTLGEIGGKPVVLVAPRGMGTTNTRDLARGLKISFRSIMYAFVVGIAGGAPFLHDKNGWTDSDIHLGDVVVSTQVIEYDFGREYENGFRRRTDVENVLSRAPAEVTNFVNQFVRGRSAAFGRILQKTNADVVRFAQFGTGDNKFYEHPGPGRDNVYSSGHRHKHRDDEECPKCSQCTEWYHDVCEEALTASCQELGCEPHRSNAVRNTRIHFGRYASGNAVMKSGRRRDLLVRADDVIGFEMEGAGAWEVFGTIVVKGVVDYADSHKSKGWRGYPAARAALCAEAMIEEIELPDRPHTASREIPQELRAEKSLPSERHRVLPRPAKSQYFGYGHILDRLVSCLLWQGDPNPRSQIICVLSGMGGVGKSETVLQFLRRNDRALRERYWAILWVDCESEASAQTDFEKIGKQCGWSSDSVKDQLASSKWQSLLILDNCDDMKTDYNRYIPNGSQVSVVLTTRLSDARKYASVDPQDAKEKLFLRLDGLDEDSAVDLVLEASDTKERSPDVVCQATEIANALDFHPLAINIASSLIQSAEYSLEDYAKALETRLGQMDLLETESEQARYKKVSTTFEVSADSLQRSASTDPTGKAALALLDILGFIHHQDISEDIFVRAWEYEASVLSEFEGKDEDGDIRHLSAWHVTQCQSIFSSLPSGERVRLFRKARALLSRLSLANVEQAGNCMSLHLLVHTWARERVPCRDETWTAVASMLALSTQEQRGWEPFTAQIVSHCEVNCALWQRMPMGNTTSEQWGLCRILRAYAGQMLQLPSTRSLDTCLQLDSQMQDLPCNPLSVATVQHLLGGAYLDNKQIPKAIEMLEHVVKAEEKLREDDPERLGSQHELACAYLADRQNTKAIEMLEHVVKAEEKLREDDPERLASQHELACAYLADRQNTKAIEILEHVAKVKEKLREDHPNRLVSQHELARAYLAVGQNTKAIEILEHVVKVKEKLREDDPERLVSQHVLARAYLTVGQNTKASEMLEHVVKVREEKLREDHPDRLGSQHQLAYAYLAVGQNTKAIEILEYVVKVKEKLREDDPDRLVSQHVLADAYWNNGQTEKALEIQEKVVPIAQRTYRAGHTDRNNMEGFLTYMHVKMREECPAIKVLPSRTQASPPRASGTPDGERSPALLSRKRRRSE